jgi:hypothetical protein
MESIMAQVIADITMRRFGWIDVNGRQRRIPRTSQQINRCIISVFKARGLAAALRK